jgi:hypothetical protein
VVPELIVDDVAYLCAMSDTESIIPISWLMVTVFQNHDNNARHRNHNKIFIYLFLRSSL